MPLPLIGLGLGFIGRTVLPKIAEALPGSAKGFANAALESGAQGGIASALGAMTSAPRGGGLPPLAGGKRAIAATVLGMAAEVLPGPAGMAAGAAGSVLGALQQHTSDPEA